jgi:lipopolysaccharide transport system permease protein
MPETNTPAVHASPSANGQAEANGSLVSATTPEPAPRYIKVMEPPTGWPALRLGEVWRYRDLLKMLVWRDISANYRQSVIGYGWALFKPVFTMVVFTLVFGMAAGIPSNDLPYPLFVFAALMPWLYFAGCLTGSSNSVVASSNLLTKVYFPRLILPLTSLASGLVDFSIQFVLLVALLAWYGVVPGWGVLLVPGFVLLCMISALSVGLWLTALNVKYRDIGLLVPFLTQMGMWLTPVAYPSTMVPERWRMLLGLNPMTGVVEGFRWALLGSAAPDWRMMAASFAVVAVLFVSGLYYFRKVERTFADVI